MCVKNADRFARLHQQCFVFFEVSQRIQNGIICLPRTGSLPTPAIDHKAVWCLRDRRIEVILDHAECCFNQPVFTC